MKNLAPTLVLFILVSCAAPKQEINLIPMYGGVKKDKGYLAADKRFLNQADQQFRSRKEASDSYAQLGWKYYEQGDLATAMKRFNQAWLLDSLNCQSYWGFGNIYGLQGKATESNTLLYKAIELNCQSPYIYEALTSNWFELYENTKEETFLKNARKSIELNLRKDPKNGRVFNQQAVYYYYQQHFDSALVAATTALTLDNSSVKPEFMQLLKSKQK